MREYNKKKYPNWVVNYLEQTDLEIIEAKQLIIKLEENKESFIRAYKKEKKNTKKSGSTKEESK